MTKESPRQVSQNRRCPQCGEVLNAEDRSAFPFCSARCKMLDLGAWTSGRYRIPSTPAPDAGIDTVAEREHDE